MLVTFSQAPPSLGVDWLIVLPGVCQWQWMTRESDRVYCIARIFNSHPQRVPFLLALSWQCQDSDCFSEMSVLNSDHCLLWCKEMSLLGSSPASLQAMLLQWILTHPRKIVKTVTLNPFEERLFLQWILTCPRKIVIQCIFNPPKEGLLLQWTLPYAKKGCYHSES